MHLYRTIIASFTIFLNAFDSGAQFYQIPDFSTPKIEILDSVGKRFHLEVDMYNELGELLSFSQELTSVYEEIQNINVNKSDSNWIFSREDLWSYNENIYHDENFYFNYGFIDLYFLPIGQIDTILQHDNYSLIARNKKGYVILIFDSKPLKPIFLETTEKPLLFDQVLHGDYAEPRYFIKSNKKSNTYELHKLISEKISSIEGEVYELNGGFIKEIKADSIISIPDYWSNHLLIKKDSRIQLIDYTTDSLILDDIVSYFLSGNEHTRSAFKYACLFYDKSGELVEHVEKMYNQNYVPELYYNGSDLLTYFVEGGFSNYSLPHLKDINMLGLPAGDINASGHGSEYLPYGFILKTDSNDYILSFDGIIQLEEKKLNDTIAVFKLKDNEYRLIQTKSNLVLLDSISEYKMLNPDLNALLLKQADTFLLYASDRIQHAKFTLFENARQEFFSEILVNFSALRGRNFEKYLKIDVDTVFSQLNRKDSSHYWSNLFSYCIYPIDTASVEVRLKLIDTLIEVFPELSELYYIKALFHVQSKNNELILSQLKILLAKAPSASNHLRSAAVLSLMSSKNKKIKNLVMDDVLQSISILEVANENPYVLADLYLFSIRYELENKLKRINVCSQLAKINKLFDDGKLTKGDFFNHDLEYIMQLRQECP
jgi:hypothetical protein